MSSAATGSRRGLAAIIPMLALAFLAPAPVQKQGGTIVGKVTVSGSDAVLESAAVTIKGTKLGAFSDKTGHFKIVNVPAGTHTLVAKRLGYKDVEKKVKVREGKETKVDFDMEERPLTLDEVVATGSTVAAAVQYSRRMIPGRGRFNTETYARIEENAFELVSESPLSTFSIDVDRASYANVRRFIQRGERPPVDAVRIEEMINYFPYARGEVSGEHPFTVATEVWRAPWKPEHRVVRIGLWAPSVETAHLPPANLVFLLDVSGSMTPPMKLPLLKKAFALLADQLRPQDRVAIVVYAGAAGVVLPSTPGDQGGEIAAALEKLQAGGSTAGGAGIKLAYEIARKNHLKGGNNRVILATDGDFNVGASSDAEMVRLIEKERDGGTFLTVLGFGTGNLKDSKMERIANHGNGNFHYIDGLLEARKVLVEEMGGTLLTVAKDVKLQIEFNPARAAGYRLIGYENRLLAAEDFNDDAKDAGELGAGHTVTALYEVVPVGVELLRPGVDPLRYQEGEEERAKRPAPAPSEFEDELMYVKVRYKDPDGTESKLLAQAVEDAPGPPSDDFRFAVAVAGFGMLLRDSKHAAGYTLDDVVALAGKGRGEDRRGYRGEFIRLVEATRDLDLLGKRVAAEEGGR